MLQRGVNISSLDTSYITSMSWYDLVMPNPNPHPDPNPNPTPNQVRVLRALGWLVGVPANFGGQPLSERLVEARNHPYNPHPHLNPNPNPNPNPNSNPNPQSQP